MADRTAELCWLLSRFNVRMAQRMKEYDVTLYTGAGPRTFTGADLDEAIMNAFNNAASLPLPK